MPLDAPRRPAADRVARLTRRYHGHETRGMRAGTLRDPDVGRLAVVSAFGAESVVLLHLVAAIRPATPVLFIDTGMLFAETLHYRVQVAEELGLTDVRTVRPDPAQLAAADPDTTLHRRDPDACCHLRKVRPLETALGPFDAWMTGRKRVQAPSRVTLPSFEADDDERVKLNPLAHWTREAIGDYITDNRLPRHPLTAVGFPSIGCRPCTTRIGAGEDLRAGRWRGQAKTECGIHFRHGRAERSGPAGDRR